MQTWGIVWLCSAVVAHGSALYRTTPLLMFNTENKWYKWYFAMIFYYDIMLIVLIFNTTANHYCTFKTENIWYFTMILYWYLTLRKLLLNVLRSCGIVAHGSTPPQIVLILTKPGWCMVNGRTLALFITPQPEALNHKPGKHQWLAGITAFARSKCELLDPLAHSMNVLCASECHTENQEFKNLNTKCVWKTCMVCDTHLHTASMRWLAALKSVT